MPTTPSPVRLTHQQPLHLWDYWAVVMKRLYAVLPFVLVCVGAAWMWTRSREPVYRAEASVEILPPPVAGADAGYAPIFTDDRYLKTQVDKFRMQQTIVKAVRSQGLDKRAVFQGMSEDEIARLAIGHVDVSVRRDRFILDIAVTGPDPQVLPHLANALAEDFLAGQQTESRRRRDAARKELEAKIDLLRKRAERAQEDKRFVLETKRSGEFKFDYEFLRQQKRLEEFDLDRDRVNRTLSRDAATYARLADAKGQIDAVRAAAGGGADPDPAAEILDSLLQVPRVRENPDVEDAQRFIANVEERLVQLESEGYGPGFEQWAKVDVSRQSRIAARRRLVEDVVKAFLAEHEGRVKEQAELDEEIARITTEVDELVRVKAEVDHQNAEILRCRHDEDVLQRQLEPIVASGYTEPETVRISQLASEPTHPIAPNHASDVALGAIVGLLGGVALAFLLDYLDDTIRTKDELAKVADVPLLGVVPNIEGRGADPTRRDLFAHHQPKSTISEAYRGVRTALTLSADASRHKVLLLTSAGPREGKTTTAINLATVLAYSGGRTLLVDADLRKPRIHKSFGLPNVRGLTNLIVSGEDPFESCLPTELENVDVLPSGPIPPNPSELLGHPRMKEVITRLRERYEHVIIDTPPIGAVTDAAVLATVVDGVILVVHAGKTRRQIVVRGLEQLRYIDAKIVGVILNNLRLSRVHYYHGYYHSYYYYSSQYGEEETPPAKEKQGAGGRRTGTPSS